MLERIKKINKTFAVISIIVAVWLHMYVKSIKQQSDDAVYLEKQPGWRNQNVQQNQCNPVEKSDHGSAK